MEKIDLSIIITTYKTKKLLDKALESLFSALENVSLDYEILLIDNNSNDGTVSLIKDKYPRVFLLENNKNYGLAFALNQGLKRAKGKYILTMDSDVEVRKNTVDKMYKYLGNNPEIGGVVPVEFKPNKKEKFVPRRRVGVDLSFSKPDLSKPISTEFTGNTFSMIKGEVYDDVGYYDEKFTYAIEDLDWAHRAKKKGYSFMILPQCLIIHHGRQGKYKNKAKMIEELYRTKFYYFKKFYHPILTFLAYGIIRLEIKLGKIKDRKNKKLKKAYEKALNKLKAEYRSDNKL